MVKIGNIEIKGKAVLAPMAGISNSAFRRICKSMGCGLMYAEMVSDKAIYYNNKKTIDMLYMTEEERPIAQQIFGCDVESFVIAAKYIEENMHPDIIDINMGCPVPKVAIRAQAGSALLKNPSKIKEIVEAVVNSVNCPVTVKIRSGWDENHINAVEVAKIIEEAGASAITIQVKNAVNIPVIGNGDIKTCFDAKKMIEETGCDLVMIGRGLLGNPWLIKEINEYLEKGIIIDKPTNIEKIDMCLRHLNYLEDFENEKQAVLEIRSHVGWYLKGISGSSEVKQEIYKTKEINEIKKMLNELKNNIDLN